MEKGLTMRGGVTPVQKYWHKLLRMVEDGTLQPSVVFTHEGPLEVGPHFYKIFDKKEDGCVKVSACTPFFDGPSRRWVLPIQRLHRVTQLK